MKTLAGKVALVTGASRGVGKGVALGLGEAGATVFVTGRTEEEGKAPEGLPGTIYQTANEITALGGRGVAVRCDHRNDVEVEAVFNQIQADRGCLDILVNSVWGGYQNMAESGEFTWEYPFWQQPFWRWDAMFQAGVRAHYVASVLAARMMTVQKGGLIVNISYWAGQKYIGNTAYGVAKAATNKMTADMAHELRDYQVAVVSLYPGLVRTENVMRFSHFMDMSNSESPQFIGRAVVGLANDPDIMAKSGQIVVAAAVAQAYGFTDIDGKQPQPLTIQEA